MRVPWAGEPHEGLKPLAPHGGPPWLWYPFSLWVSTPGGRILPGPRLCSSYLSQCGLFSCRKSVLLVFRSFSEAAPLHAAVVLTCPWEEVSSGSSYYAIMIQNPKQVFLSRENRSIYLDFSGVRATLKMKARWWDRVHSGLVLSTDVLLTRLYDPGGLSSSKLVSRTFGKLHFP